MAAGSGYRKGLVDLGTGRVSREIFVDEAIYAQEQERLFARAWLFVGHESQIPNPGDWVATTVGETAVVVTRGQDSAINAFVNRCAHRGNLLCFERKGSGKDITCIYHGWIYDLGGKLTGVAFERGASFQPGEARLRGRGRRLQSRRAAFRHGYAAFR